MYRSGKLVGLAVALALSALSHAGDKQPLKRSESLEATATVASIDQSTRTLVLKGESGATFVVEASPDVRNLAQVKAGDRVHLVYTIAVAAQVQPKGTPMREPIEATTERRAPPGSQPGGSAGHSVITTVKIDSVDTSFNTVTFKRADGVTRTVAVDHPDGQRFIRTLKPGDSVEISYTEAIAVSVSPVSH